MKITHAIEELLTGYKITINEFQELIVRCATGRHGSKIPVFGRHQGTNLLTAHSPFQTTQSG